MFLELKMNLKSRDLFQQYEEKQINPLFSARKSKQQVDLCAWGTMGLQSPPFGEVVKITKLE